MNKRGIFDIEDFAAVMIFLFLLLIFAFIFSLPGLPTKTLKLTAEPGEAKIIAGKMTVLNILKSPVEYGSADATVADLIIAGKTDADALHVAQKEIVSALFNISQSQDYGYAWKLKYPDDVEYKIGRLEGGRPEGGKGDKDEPLGEVWLPTASPNEPIIIEISGSKKGVRLEEAVQQQEYGKIVELFGVDYVYWGPVEGIEDFGAYARQGWPCDAEYDESQDKVVCRADANGDRYEINAEEESPDGDAECFLGKSEFEEALFWEDQDLVDSIHPTAVPPDNGCTRKDKDGNWIGAPWSAG